ncbi:MAG: hypothetical protein IKJ27_07155 [Clostridia bacterium]|nr:hypothetical protein [Clostridia bacterium]
MDIIQQILLVLKVLVSRITKIFTFVSNQFLPALDDETVYGDNNAIYF